MELIGNLFEDIPPTLPGEVVEELIRARHARIERILSHGQSSPETGWYDQDEHEWVLVLQGAGRLLFDDQREVLLNPGDHLLIPAHCRHRVVWTDPEQVTLWLAVFFREIEGAPPHHEGAA
ncbi:cupin domain-containing protein [Thiorhodovibrio winogradskyi]|nr:cupin domain-containing protein [Thiorhodovibrio winogradskyi]